MDAIVFARTSGVAVTARHVLHLLHRRGQLRGLALSALAEEIAISAARAAGLSVADADLQHAANRFRQRHGLTTTEQTNRWLAADGLSVEDFEAGIERDLLIDKFKDHLATDRVDGHFAAHRERHARAQLRQIVVASEEIARELLAQVNHEGSDFAELARAHSLHDPSRGSGGSLGLVPRYALPEPAAATIFSAKPGAVVGPVATERGFHLFLVEALTEPVLDDVAATVIREELFTAWLQEQLRDVRIDLSGLESMEWTRWPHCVDIRCWSRLILATSARGWRPA